MVADDAAAAAEDDDVVRDGDSCGWWWWRAGEAEEESLFVTGDVYFNFSLGKPNKTEMICTVPSVPLSLVMPSWLIFPLAVNTSSIWTLAVWSFWWRPGIIPFPPRCRAKQSRPLGTQPLFSPLLFMAPPQLDSISLGAFGLLLKQDLWSVCCGAWRRYYNWRWSFPSIFFIIFSSPPLLFFCVSSDASFQQFIHPSFIPLSFHLVFKNFFLVLDGWLICLSLRLEVFLLHDPSSNCLGWFSPASSY